MILVGIDWGETEHAACLLTPAGVVQHRLRVPHTAEGLRQLQQVITAVEPDPATVLVALERPDGLLVTTLLAVGYTIYALNPKQVDRYRDRTRLAGAKSDPADAELLARILLTDRDRHRPLQPSSATVEELRAIARDDERASRDQRRILNRLRADLLAVFPQALVAFPDLATVSAAAFLAHWSTPAHAQQLSLAEIERFLRQHHHAQPRAAAARIHTALHGDALVAPAQLVRAKAGAISLAAQQLQVLHRQRTAWEKQLRALLEGEHGHPDGEILVSLPGLDVVLAARVLGEMGDRRDRFPTAAALQCYAGTAPVTRASGKGRRVSMRSACNRVLRAALLRWAFCSVPKSAWAHAFYDAHRATGKSHVAVLRLLANRWLEILHHLLLTRQRYDEAIHHRNRSKPPLPHAA